MYIHMHENMGEQAMLCAVQHTIAKFVCVYFYINTQKEKIFIHFQTKTKKIITNNFYY